MLILVVVCIVMTISAFGQNEDSTYTFVVVDGEDWTPQIPKRSVSFRQFMDTNDMVFKDIYHLWQDYQNDLLENDMSYRKKDVTKYWYDGEIETYGDGYDLYKMLALSYYSVYVKENFIGINKRNDTLYELQSAYYNGNDNTFSLWYVMTVPVIKTRDGNYKFYNKFSLNKHKLTSYKIDFATYLFPQDYPFDKKNAKQKVEQVKALSKHFGLSNIKPIIYYVDFSYTDVLHTFGIDVSLGDYLDVKGLMHEGRANIPSRIVTYTSGGERHCHEFLHVLVSDMRGHYNEETNMFDEGVCSYFGDMQRKNYSKSVVQLKAFLNDNPQVDLSKDLCYAFRDKKGKYVSEGTEDQEHSITKEWLVGEDVNYSYIILAVVCDIAFRQGRYNKVRQMILEYTSDNDLYSLVEKHLGIKQSDVDKYIRDFLNATY
jgi:hypothetical protein